MQEVVRGKGKGREGWEDVDLIEIPLYLKGTIVFVFLISVPLCLFVCLFVCLFIIFIFIFA